MFFFALKGWVSLVLFWGLPLRKRGLYFSGEGFEFCGGFVWDGIVCEKKNNF